MKPLIVSAILMAATAVFADELPDTAAFDPAEAQIIILGEVHDNPAHHRNQASIVAAVSPSALVFEMLNADQAATANGMERSDGDALAGALGWEESGWPEFAFYYPIFLAAPEARIYGAAVPRGDLMSAMSEGAATLFGEEAARFGLDPLPDAVQQEREAFQLRAHCDALPVEMLPGMVEAQRLRDARFSATTLQALRETGGPVVVITGNGHARRDWGMPAYLSSAAPEASVVTLAQFEEAAPDGDVPHDFWLLTEAAERDDPCEAFGKSSSD